MTLAGPNTRTTVSSAVTARMRSTCGDPGAAPSGPGAEPGLADRSALRWEARLMNQPGPDACPAGVPNPRREWRWRSSPMGSHVANGRFPPGGRAGVRSTSRRSRPAPRLLVCVPCRRGPRSRPVSETLTCPRPATGLAPDQRRRHRHSRYIGTADGGSTKRSASSPASSRALRKVDSLRCVAPTRIRTPSGLWSGEVHQPSRS